MFSNNDSEFWYISLPSLHDCDVKFPDLMFYGRRKHMTTNFSLSFKTLELVLRNRSLFIAWGGGGGGEGSEDFGLTR